MTYVLRTHTGGGMAIDKIDANHVPQGTLIQGGSGDWYAKAIAAGPDNSAFVLWNHPHGSSIVWRVESNGVISRYNMAFYCPADSTYFGKDIVVRNNGEPQILMTDQEGRAYIATFSAINFDSIVFSEIRYETRDGNNNLWRPTALGNGVKNQTRLLYNA